MGVTKVDTDAQWAPMINQLFTMPLFGGRLLCTQASAGEAKFNVEEECSLPASALWENMEKEGELFSTPADSSTIFPNVVFVRLLLLSF